jgi:hypothetical protein
MNIFNMLKLLVIMLIFSACSCSVSSTKTKFSSNYPDRDQASIVSSWGVPAEVLIRSNAGKLGSNVVTWIYYLEDESGDIAPVFFNFKNGKSLATNAFGGEKRRVLDINLGNDFKRIISERERIKKTWPIWD